MSDMAVSSGIDSTPPQFVVPEIALPFSAPPVRDDRDELRESTIEWGLRHGLIGRRGAARLADTPLLDFGIALAGPAAAERAHVVMIWFLWAIVLDDRIDDGPWAEDGTLGRFLDVVSEISAGSLTTESRDPMLVAFAEDMWPRACELGGQAWRRRLRDHLVRHLDAQRTLVRLRDTTVHMSAADYLSLRRDSFGALLVFDLIEGANGLDEDPDPCGEGCWEKLRDLAADIMGCVNDIHSVAKDVVCGEQFNLVRLLVAERDIGWQDAADAAHALLMSAVEEFVTTCDEHELHKNATPVAGAKNPARLRQIIRAAQDWHQEVSRYHLQAAAPVAHGRIDTRFNPPTLKSRQFETDPYPLYERLRTSLPVVYDEPTDAWLLSRHADVKMAFADPRFSNENYLWQIGPLLGHSVVSMDGHEHTIHRALLNPMFRSRAIEVLRQSINEVASHLVERLRGHRNVDLIAEFTSVLPIQVMARALGVPADTPEQVHRLKNWCTVGFAYLGNYRQDPGLLTGGLANRDDFYEYLQPHLDARRLEPRDDLISTLLSSTVDGQPLTESYIRGCCAILLTAGSETSHGAMANLIVNVLDEPGLKEAVLDDPALLDNALTETLRRDPSLQLVLRQTTEVVDLPSGTVPANATVACLIGSANRDPDRFDRPEEFDMHRADGGAVSHFAFGAGRHFCLGSHLARAEITTGLGLLLRAYPDLRWTPGFRPRHVGFLNRCPARLEVAL